MDRILSGSCSHASAAVRARLGALKLAVVAGGVVVWPVCWLGWGIGQGNWGLDVGGWRLQLEGKLAVGGWSAGMREQTAFGQKGDADAAVVLTVSILSRGVSVVGRETSPPPLGR